MSETPLIELERHEWRLKGARRVTPFKKQPARPSGRERGPLVKWMMTFFGVWAGLVIIWAHEVPGQNPWIIAPISIGPGLLALLIMLLNDD
jgi:hypothetical protein